MTASGASSTQSTLDSSRRVRRTKLIALAVGFLVAVAGAGVAITQLLNPAQATEDTTALDETVTTQPIDSASIDATSLADVDVALGPDEASETLESSGYAQPSPHPTGVTIVGDSLVVGNEDALREAIPGVAVDARVGRQFSEGVQIVAALREADELTDTVIIELGTNGYISEAHMDAMLLLLSDVPNVIFTNVRVPRDWEHDVNERIAEAAEAHEPVSVIDWYDHTQGRPELLGGDGYHLSTTGNREFTQLLTFFATAS